MATFSVVLGVRDLEREIKFFTGIGFTEAGRSDHSASLVYEGVAVELHGYDHLRVADGPLLEWDRSPAGLGAGVQLYFEIEDPDAFAQAIPLGIPRPWPVQDKPWGMRELTLKTPSGYLLTFARPRAR